MGWDLAMPSSRGWWSAKFLRGSYKFELSLQLDAVSRIVCSGTAIDTEYRLPYLSVSTTSSASLNLFARASPTSDASRAR